MFEINANLKSSTSALMNEFHAITHNIANANTAGFKRRESSFSGKLDEQTGKLNSGPDGGIEFNSEIDFTQGSLEQTERPMDLAINGKAFFVIESPEGAKYTRNGQLNINSTGQITDSLGRIIAGENGPITVPPEISQSQVVISKDGNVFAGDANIGKIRMVEFGDRTASLIPAGDSCFLAPEDANPVAASKSMIEQGFRESSNVDSVKETINLMTVSRMYEASMKVISKQGESVKSILNVAMG